MHRHPARKRALKRALTGPLTPRLRVLRDRYRAEWRLAVRSVTAAVAADLVAGGLDLPQFYWSVITALIVVQTSLGGTLGAGLDRLVGTIVGAALGVAALFAQRAGLPPVVAMALAVAPLSLLAALRANYRIAPVTAVIVLLSPSVASPFLPGLYRVMEILVGTAIGLLVSVLVLPARAGLLALERGARMLDVLAELLDIYLVGAEGDGRQAAIERLNDRVRAELAAVAAAATEARREQATRIPGKPLPERLVRMLRRLHADVVFIGRSTNPRRPDLPDLAAMADGFRQALAAGSAALVGSGAPTDLASIDAALALLRAEAPGQEALLFVLEMLRRDLADFIAAVAPKTE